MDQQSTRTDITVNVDGFWMLQALLDIRHVAPDLRCRPYVSTDSNDWLTEHPGMAVMREQGIVVGDEVQEQVAARMRVLAAPDIEVVALLSRGKLRYGIVEDENQPPGSRDIPDNEFRVVLARRANHWVSAVRVGNDITVDDVAIADSGSIASLVMDGLESIHHADAAAINAVNVPLEEMLEATKSWQGIGLSTCSPAEICAGWASAPLPWPRWAKPCQTPRPRSRCTRGNTATTRRAPAPRCCRSRRSAPVAALRSINKHGLPVLGRGVAGHLPGDPATCPGRREDRTGHAALWRVEDAHPRFDYRQLRNAKLTKPH